jgi:CRISPR/Cas system-associated endonuclease/helicase Cas3
LGEDEGEGLQNDGELQQYEDEPGKGKTEANNITGIHLLDRLPLHTKTPQAKLKFLAEA